MVGFSLKNDTGWLHRMEVACLALLGTISVGHILKAEPTALTLSNSVLSLLCFFALFKLWEDAIAHRASCYEWCCTSVVGLCFAICMVWGSQWYQRETVDFIGGTTLVDILVLAMLFAACLQGTIRLLHGLGTLTLPRRLVSFHGYLAGHNGMLLSWIIVFACWLPVFLVTFPGVYHYDAPAQLAYYYVNGIIEQPPLHTLFLVGCISLGETLFSSVSSGFALATLIQMLILSASAGYSVHWLARRGYPKGCALLALAIFSLVTLYPLSAVGSSKDFLFGAFFLQLFLLLLEMQSEPEVFFQSWKKWLSFIFISLLTMSFRLTGYYIYILWSAIAVLVLRRFWKRLVPLVVVAATVYGLFMGPVSAALGIHSRPSRVALGIPLQMVTRAVVESPEAISPMDLALFYEVVDGETLESAFVSGYADPVLDRFQSDVYGADSSRYQRAWLRIARQAPQAYLDELVSMTVGWWYPDMNQPNLRNGIRYIPYAMTTESVVDIQRSSVLPELEPFFQTMANAATFQRIPMVSMLFSNGWLIWLTLSYGLLSCLRRKWRNLSGLCFLLALVGSLLLSPVVTPRYIFPLVMCMPVLYALLARESGKYCKGKELLS